MSHELRTPLTAIIGFGEVMQEHAFGPIRSERYDVYVTDIVRSAKHLLSIINEIIEYSRAESLSKREIEFGSVDIEESLRFASEVVEAAYKHKQFRTTISVEPNLPALRADETLIRQVFINLMTNAARAVEVKGHLTITASQSPEGLKIEFQDDGPDIPSELLERIFLPFEQGARDIHKSPERGLGLGLTIVKSILNQHDAKVSIQNVSPSGLKVVLSLPPRRSAKDRPSDQSYHRSTLVTVETVFALEMFQDLRHAFWDADDWQDTLVESLRTSEIN